MATSTQPGFIVHTNIGRPHHRVGRWCRTSKIEAISRLLSPVLSRRGNDRIFAGALWSKAAVSAVWFATAIIDEDVVTILRPNPIVERSALLAAEVARTALAGGI